MAVWKITGEDKKRLISLTENVDDENKATLNEILTKKQINIDDIQKIKDSLPPSVPIFPFLNKLVVGLDSPKEEYKASDEFRKKTEALRQKQENMAYKRMVESVDPNQKYGKVDLMENFGSEMKAVNRQLMSIINVIITVVGSFFFGFTGITYAYPHLNLDLATRFLIGLLLATIVFFADLYFVVKSMDEELPDNEKGPFENSHNLNFREVERKAEGKQPNKTKSATEKKND